MIEMIYEQIFKIKKIQLYSNQSLLIKHQYIPGIKLILNIF